jgi:UDPglucose 6-dehydrogenase
MRRKKKLKIGIIGIGTVGKAVEHWFNKETYPLFLYDKYKKIGSIQEVNKAEIVFICVPTPFHEKSGYDDTAVIEALNILSPPKIVVIKSTILPGSTEKFQKQFPQYKVLFNPEFLVAKTAKQDFLKPNKQIIGYTSKSRKIAKKILKILPRASCQRIVPSKEAEMIKYFVNCFLAMRVVFANQIYDLCQVLGINYELVKELAGYDPRIGYSHFNVFQDGYRGYSGPCLDKDVKAFIQFAKSHKVKLSLFEIMDKINEGLIKNNNLHDNH